MAIGAQGTQADGRLWSRSAMLVAAAAALSTGNILARYWAATYVIGVGLCAGAGLIAYAVRWAPRGPAPLSVWLCALVCSAVSLGGEPVPWAVIPLLVAVMTAAVVFGRRWRAPLLFAGSALVAVWTARAIAVGPPPIDVFRMIQGATGAFLHGSDPYRPTFAGTSYAGTFPYHFPYGPSVVLLAAPGRLLGDVRLAGAVMIGVIALGVTLLSARNRRGLDTGVFLGTLAICPLAPSMVYLAWAESYGLAALTVWLVLRERHRRLGVVALGVCLAAKPTLGAVLLLAAVWSRSVRRDLVVAFAVAVVTVAPFVVWDGPGNLAGLVRGAAGLGGHTYVNDPLAVTVNTLVHLTTGQWLPSLALLGILVCTAAPILMTRPRDHCDLFAGGAALTIAVLLSSRIAFMNYYYVAFIALLIALAYEGALQTGSDIALPWMDGGAKRRSEHQVLPRSVTVAINTA